MPHVQQVSWTVLHKILCAQECVLDVHRELTVSLSWASRIALGWDRKQILTCAMYRLFMRLFYEYLVK